MDSDLLEGVVVCHGGPKLSHLFFADDSLIFCKATLANYESLQRILEDYEKASDQQLNRAKMSLFFSSNTSNEAQEEIKQRFGAQDIKQHEKYLRLPSLVGRNKRSTFNAIKDKVGKKLEGWKEKIMSKYHGCATCGEGGFTVEGREWGMNLVWEDKWLPLSSMYKVVSPNTFLHANTCVSELIDLENASWKSTVIDALFLPREAETIKSIPLSSRLPGDRLIWAMSSNVQFSVHSTYSLAVNLSQAANKGNSSNTSLVRRFWKPDWSLPVPHKTQHFMWRACREAFPTKVNLARRKVVMDNICDVCGLKAVSTGHVL
ncbi:uncharacterized protein LOC142615512 [Castanea sativa]|uniref:uncharacterized protein LOC142615512 n=1 Tax=Castanea sativa TaxID=21020 RepID=UPI003F64D3B7